MKSWSDNPIHGNFVIKVFCDTNILVYLIDHTYESLNKLIQLLIASPFIQVVSSKYVIFEFVGVRKREHYLRIAAEKSPKNPEGKINFSSLIKYVDEFNSPHAPFADLAEEIQKNINNEIERLFEEFSIDYEYSDLHKDQLNPTFDVCLNSKLANQDSLVLVSSVLPFPQITNDNVYILTNDTKFVTHFKDSDLKGIFSKYKIPYPQLAYMEQFNFVSGNSINLTAERDNEELKNFVNEQTIKFLKQSELFLGEIIMPRSLTIPENIICFKVKKEREWRNDVYITVISKNLEFIYTVKRKIDHFEHQRTKITDGQIFTSDGLSHIAFKAFELDEDGNEKSVENEILNALKEEGNLVFIHPDS